jgi:hypothetical protein
MIEMIMVYILIATLKTVTVCDSFSNPPVFVIKFAAGEASCYGSGSGTTKKMQLLGAPAPQH